MEGHERDYNRAITRNRGSSSSSLVISRKMLSMDRIIPRFDTSTILISIDASNLSNLPTKVRRERFAPTIASNFTVQIFFNRMDFKGGWIRRFLLIVRDPLPTDYYYVSHAVSPFDRFFVVSKLKSAKNVRKEAGKKNRRGKTRVTSRLVLLHNRGKSREFSLRERGGG